MNDPPAAVDMPSPPPHRWILAAWFFAVGYVAVLVSGLIKVWMRGWPADGPAASVIGFTLFGVAAALLAIGALAAGNGRLRAAGYCWMLGGIASLPFGVVMFFGGARLVRPAPLLPLEPDFLASLPRGERSTVSNLSDVEYLVILHEKTSNGAPYTVVSDGTERSNASRLLRRLKPAEIERLRESARRVREADDTLALRGPLVLGVAGQLYRTAAEINQWNDLALMSYGTALASMGHVGAGIRWVRQAIKANPANHRARENLQRMLDAQQVG